VVFADLFAPGGVLVYPFAPPGAPAELAGREAIRAYFAGLGSARELLDMEGVEAVVRQTDDPEVVVTEITHHGWSRAAGERYRFTALGVIRVRDGQIVRYEDYMDPIAMARILGRTADLAAALSGA
jgi:ketosteroid isomerase-like protein